MTSKSPSSDNTSGGRLQWLTETMSHSFAPRCGPIGIEFRDGLVRVVQVARDRRSHVLASTCLPYDPQAPDRVAAALVRAIDGGGFRGRSCVIGLPFSVVRAEACTVPDGEDELICAEIARNASLRFGFAQPQIDFLRLGPAGSATHDGRVEIAAIVADRVAIEAYVHPLVDRGLLPDAAEPGFVSAARACSRSFRRESDQQKTRVAVDLHEDGATACLLLGDAIAYCRCVDAHGDIASAVRACQLDGGRFVNGEAASEIRLVGNAAYDTGLATRLENACGIPVRLDDQCATLGSAYERIGVHSIGSARAGGAAAWAGAIGLAFRDVDGAAAARSHSEQHGRREAA